MSERLTLAGLRFFLFSGFKHRMGHGASDTAEVGAAGADGNTHFSKSRVLSLEPRTWSNPSAKHFDPNGRM